jgi:hypothetical protein
VPSDVDYEVEDEQEMADILRMRKEICECLVAPLIVTAPKRDSH